MVNDSFFGSKENVLSDEWKTRQSLLMRAKDPSDEEAWAEFVKYYERFIFHLLHRMNINADDFNDLVQDILVKLWKNLKSYDVEKAKFRTWLAGVVRNAVYDYFSREKRRSVTLEKEQEITSRLYNTSANDMEVMIEKEWISYLSGLAMDRMQKVFSGDAALFNRRLQGSITLRDTAGR